MSSIIETINTWSSANPVYLFLAIAILPAIGFPASPLLILAGVVWGSTWQACTITLAAVALNMSVSYALAVGPAHSVITRLLGSRWDRWRNVHPDNHRRFTIVMRITPGIPFFLQNYVLGLVGIPYLTYIFISVPLNAIFTIGFVLTGGAIFQGNLALIAAGIAIIIVGFLALRMLRNALAKR